jgi:multidrug efflux pump subunit AcrB
VVEWFARNHVAANMLMLFLVVGGVVGVMSMRAETFPTVDPRLITVTVPFPGATPAEVEDGITSRVEEAVIGLEGIKRVTSTASENAGVIRIELEEFADGDEVRNDVETEIDRLADFPPENAEEAVIVRNKPTPGVINLVLYGDTGEKVLKYWAERIQEEIIRTTGSGLVGIQGDRDYQISIEISEEKLRRHGLTIGEVARTVGRFSRNLPAGTVESPSGDILLRINEKGETGRDFRDIVVRRDPDGSLVRLSDIADVRDGLRDVDLVTRYNGMPAVFIRVSRSQAQDTLALEQEVVRYLAGLKLPEGLGIDVWESETKHLKDRINLLGRNALIGFALVFLMLILFLDLRLAFWTAFAIPVSFLGGLLIAYAAGVSINMISLFALIVVLGIVVDDAIIVGESIFTRQNRGEQDEEAAVGGVGDVRAPVTIGVLTTVAAFAPLLFVTGTLGQILRVIPVVVIAVILVSLLEAYLILPAHLSSSKRWSTGPVAWISTRFSRLLERFVDRVLTPLITRCLAYRYLSLACFVGILLVSVGVYRGGFLKFDFFPAIEGENVTVNLTMPVGTSFADTRRYAEGMLQAARRVQKGVREQGGGGLYEGVVLVVGQTISEARPGREGGEDRGSNRAQLQVKLVDPEERSLSARQVETRLREEIGTVPGAEEIVYESSLVRPGPDINIELGHPDTDKLAKASEMLMEKMGTISGLVEISDTLKRGKREYVFSITKAGLAAGLTPTSLGEQLRSSFFGREVHRIQRSSSELKVMVRYPEGEREDIESIHEMRVRLPDGSSAPLRTVADIAERVSLATIERANGQRVSNVTADTDVSRITANEAVPMIFGRILPELKSRFPELDASLQGESRDRREDLAALGRNMIIGLMVIFVMLGSLLRSYAQPLIILSVVPFGIVGAFAGHLLLGYNLSFISLFGIVALTGVLVNDSVVLIDYYNRLRALGESVGDALVDAVKRRFRPILLTTVTTSMGLLPILLETSLQARFLIPMAISLAFGLMFGTVIILFLVPSLAAILEDLKRLGRRAPPRQRQSDGRAGAGRD